jgi:hypothetical protein
MKSDQIADAIERHKITDEELKDALQLEGVKKTDEHIKQWRDGGLTTLALALAVFRIIGKREVAA